MLDGLDVLITKSACRIVSPQEKVGLHLAFCTGLVMYSTADPSAPYLVAVTHGFVQESPFDSRADQVRTGKEFKEGRSGSKLSLPEVVDFYKHELGSSHSDTPSLGFYVASGTRVMNVTDLAVVHYLESEGHELMGGDLNRPCMLVVDAQRRVVERFKIPSMEDLVRGSQGGKVNFEKTNEYKIGESYPLNNPEGPGFTGFPIFEVHR